ncbi:uncharacterized protein PG998_004606 [Apiospora kogelbergensis]|uniref:uncharacterized protein n=1 Tax=Apiospora kogelbergensis TaxID=1337665 RepID=UPI00312D4CEC
MEDLGPIEGTPDTNTSIAKKRRLRTFFRDPQAIYETPSKRPYYSHSLSSRVTDWLSQVPSEGPPKAPLRAPLKAPLNPTS